MKLNYHSIITGGLLCVAAAIPGLAQDVSSSQQALSDEKGAPNQGVVQYQGVQQQPGNSSGEVLGQNIPLLGRPSGNTEHPLLVRFSRADPKAEANLSDDLAVMSHLLQKTIAEKFGNLRAGRNVLGVDIGFGPGSQPIRTLYLEDYGTLFLLNVAFPLHPVPKQAQETKQTEATDSAWEDAKREYYGQSSAEKAVSKSGVPYDEQKVSALKEAIIEALRSAVNIRGLKPSDTVAVCVAGSGPSRAISTIGLTPMDRSGLGGGMYYLNMSFMSIRAKKSDIDAFAVGKLNSQDFSRAVILTTYFGFAERPPSPGGPYGYSARFPNEAEANPAYGN